MKTLPSPEVVEVYGKMHPEDRKQMLDFFYKARLGKVKDFKGEMRILASGNKRPMELDTHQRGSQPV